MYTFNWIDIVIFAALFLYGLGGYSLGFFKAILDLIGFTLSFLLALKLYSVIGSLLAQYFSIPLGISYASCFFVIAIVSEIIFGAILRRFVVINLPIIKFMDRILGILAGILSSLVLVSFLLTFIIAVPVSSFLKTSVMDSRVGSSLVARSQGFEENLNNIFGGAVTETLNFLTVEPTSKEVVNLHFKTEKYSIDKKAESQMFILVNKERASVRLVELDSNSKLQDLARKHCEDMIRRGYFSHYTQEGLSPFDRMNKANVYYTYAGENLALSPNAIIAMQGLMQSEGHRENVLSPNFGKIGIGVVDTGIVGKAFCQEFTD